MEENRFRRWNRKEVFFLLPVFLLYAIYLSFFINWSDFLHNPPIHYTDYATHYSSVWSVSTYLDHGHLWGYNPYFHAGFPDGTLFDMDNKGVEVLSWLISKTSLPLPLSYNLVILAFLITSPFMLYFAARVLNASPGESAIAAIFTIFLWFGDFTWSWAWQGGMIAFLAAGCLGIFCAGVFWRWSFSIVGSLSNKWFAAWFIVGGLIFWLHPLALVILGVPFAVVIFTVWGGWDRRRRLWIGAWIIWVLVVNAPWWTLLLRFLPDKTGSEQFLQGGWSQLLVDLHSTYLGLRLILVFLALLGIHRWRKDGNPTWLPAGISILALALLAYLGVYLGLGSLQPYRFIIPALALCTLPAGAGFLSLWQKNHLVQIALLVSVLGAAFFPLYSARPRRHLQYDGTPRDYLSGLRSDEQSVCDELKKQDLLAGRVLSTDWRLGAALPYCSGAQVIGGPFFWVWTSYGYANAGFTDVFGQELNKITPNEMSSLLDQYNIHWVVVNTRPSPKYYTLDLWNLDHPGLFTAAASFGVFEIYQVAHPSSWFVEGEGNVEAGQNLILVKAASKGNVVLKYHWIDSLRVSPPVSLTPVKIGLDPQPFIKVDNGNLTDFMIYQAYK